MPDAGTPGPTGDAGASALCPDEAAALVEPSLPLSACATLMANKATPDESKLDTTAIQSALTSCAGKGAVHLVASGSNSAFVSGPLALNGELLWLDEGVTLYASRNASLYQKSGKCGAAGVDDSSGCIGFLSVTGTGAGIVGKGIVDGQGGEPLVGQSYSWWDLSTQLRASNGSAPNPALIEVKNAKNFVMYQVTLHNSPKFHVKLGSAGFTVWGVTILTPSSKTSSAGKALTPYDARNTDGIDPGSFSATSSGVIAYSTISTGDDDVAIKGAYGTQGLTIAHNHFGTGHGMSIGSETNGGVSQVRVCDLTIDGDSRPTGGAPASDVNGIRIKSDASRGGLVTGITYTDVCIRDIDNPLLLNPNYSTASGSLIPQFGNIVVRNFHAVSGTNGVTQQVTLDGYDAQHTSAVTLDNVVVDGTPMVNAAYASVTLGPGPVSFAVPSTGGVTVTDKRVAGSGIAPYPCSFPALPPVQ